MKQILLALLLAPALLAKSADVPSPDSAEMRALTLRIYNYVGLEDAVLHDAQRESERILRQVGIQTAWLDCPISAEEMETNRSCAAKPSANHLIVKLLPKAMSKKFRMPRGIFGFAMPTAKGRPGDAISLFYERVVDLAYHGGVGTSFADAQALILGHMTAHEVGHLLLGPDSHSSSGVMSFPWSRRTLTNMERGRLKFSDAERGAMHRELDRRAALSAN